MHASRQVFEASSTKTGVGTEVSSAPTCFVKPGRYLGEKTPLFVTSGYLLPKGKVTNTVRCKESFQGGAALRSPQPGEKLPRALALQVAHVGFQRSQALLVFMPTCMCQHGFSSSNGWKHGCYLSQPANSLSLEEIPSCNITGH